MATRTRTTRAKAEPVEDEAPATKAASTTKGMAWLQEHIEGVLGEEVPATKLRVILRNLVKDGEVEHEAGHGWTFTGIKDPAVRGVIAKLKAQAKAAPADDEEDEVAVKRAARKAPAKKAAPAKRTSRAKAKPVVEEEDEDLYDDEEDIDLDD